MVVNDRGTEFRQHVIRARSFGPMSGRPLNRTGLAGDIR